MNEKYESTEQAQNTPVVSLASTWDEVEKTTSKMIGVFNQHQATEDQLAIQANKYSIATQVMDLTTQAKEEASKQMNPVDAAKTYKAVVQGGTEGIMQHVFARNEPYVKEVLAYKVDEAKQSLAGATAVRAKEDAYVSFSNSYNTYSNEMANAANRGDKVAAATLYGQTKSLVNQAVSSGALNPVRGAVFQQNVQKGFHSNIVLGQYRNAVATGEGAQFKKDFMKSKQYDSYMSPKDKQAMLTQFGRMDVTAAAVDGINKATDGEASKQQIFNSVHGNPVDPKVMADLATTDPKLYQRTLTSVREGQVQHLIVSEYDDASVSTIKAGIANLTNLENVAKTYQEQSVRLAAAKQLTAKLKTLQDDPATVAVHSQAYQAVMKKQKAAGTLDPLGARIAYQKHLGIDNSHISALTNEEAYNEVTIIKHNNSVQDQLSSYLNYIKKIKPANRPYAVRDLQKAGLPLATQYLLRGAKDREASQYTTVAATAWDPIQLVKGKEDYDAAYKVYSSVFKTKGLGSVSKVQQGIESNSDYTKYANVILSSGGNVTKRLDDYRNHFELLTMQLMATGSTEDAAVKIAEQFMNAGTSMDSYRGSHYIYDSKLKNDTVSGACNTLVANYTKSGDFVVPARYHADIWGVDKAAVKSHFINNVSFINSADQTGLTMVWGLRNNPVLDKSGKRITFSFKELRDTTSPLSKQVVLNASASHQQNVLLQKGLQEPGITAHGKAVLRFFASEGVLM